MNLETFDFSAQQLQQLEDFSSDARLVLCLLGSLLYCTARQLEHIRVMTETE